MNLYTIILGLIVALPVLIHLAGRWSGVRTALPATHFQWFGDIHPFSSHSMLPPPTARTRATLGWIVGTILLETVIVAIAVVGSALYRTGEVHDRPREILAYTATHAFVGSRLLELLGALLVGAIFAKVVSTANNYLFSPATNLVNDVFVRYIKRDAGNKQILLISRLMVVALGSWALYQSLGTTSVLQKSLYAYTIHAAARTPVILAAFFWKRAAAAGAVASIAIGTAVTVAWDSLTPHFPAIIAQQDAILPALIASLLCLFIVSLATRPPTAKQLAPFAS